jgi:YD repeat-containing protein
VIGFGYDALNRLTTIDRPNSSYWETDDTFAYDNLGRRTSASTSVGNQLSFTYDALGRLTSEASNWHGTSTSEYDASGRRTRRTYALGLGGRALRLSRDRRDDRHPGGRQYCPGDVRL